MNISELKNLFERIKNDKKALIVITVGLIGMLLIMISDTNNSDDVIENPKENFTSEYELAIEVEKLVETIDGAGKCKVMITYSSYEETVYALDKDENFNSQGETNFSAEYVILDNGDYEDGLKLKIISPEIKGVAVVCQGGNNPVIKEQIISSLSALFDISSNKISVAVMAK
jgi:stage III sporulation protein AG